MRLTKQTMFAVRAMIHCAANEPELSRVKDIAAAHGISEFFLFKIVRTVADRGLIETVRGRRGGIRLARPADQITLLEAVRSMEDSFDLSECFEAGGEPCPTVGRCPLHVALDRALANFFSTLEAYTIADLARDPDAAHPLLAIE